MSGIVQKPVAKENHKAAALAPSSRMEDTVVRAARAIALTVLGTPEEVEAFIRKEADRWSKVLADVDIKYD
jgi:hypothetical protein